MTGSRRKKKKMSVLNKFLFLICVLLVLVIGAAAAYFLNQITEVTVKGNVYYTEEEIQKLVIDGELEHNAWYLYGKYHYGSQPEIPFIDKIEIEITGRGKVTIQVYEKGTIGYVEYLGSYMYFDKDGMVVESSDREVPGKPRIIGLEFDSIVLNEKLPVENDKVFQYILNLTNELKKNDIMPDKIQFSEDLEATLYFDEAKVFLGKDENQNEKLTTLKSVIPRLEGKSGVLHMEEVDEENKNIIFKTDGE